MGRKPRREDPDVRRSQILAAAKRSFRERGLQATTVDAIAREADVSVGLLYRFFKSKAEMVKAMIVEDAEVQLEQAALLLQDSTPSGDLSKVLTAGLVDTAADPERLALTFEIAAEICRNPALSDFMRKKHAELHKELARRLELHGIDRRQARLRIERLDRASAVATGLAVHALIYSESISRLKAAARRIIEAVLASSNPQAE